MRINLSQTAKGLVRLNPLNQVYVFNLALFIRKISEKLIKRLNPLNQVYVFNPSEMEKILRKNIKS